MDVQSVASTSEAVNSAVFLCGSCNLPLGDSGDQKPNLDQEDVILLSGVTNNVKINEFNTPWLDTYSIVQILYCRGCTSSIGVFYVGTPRHLDYRRELFCLNKCAITCYSFALTSKQRVIKSEENHQTVSSLEEQMKKCRAMFGQCSRVVRKLEEKVFPDSESD